MLHLFYQLRELILECLVMLLPHILRASERALQGHCILELVQTLVGIRLDLVRLVQRVSLLYCVLVVAC